MAMADPLLVPPRCWADTTSVLVNGHAIECQALGTERLGLCPRHAEEMLEPVPSP